MRDQPQPGESEGVRGVKMLLGKKIQVVGGVEDSRSDGRGRGGGRG